QRTAEVLLGDDVGGVLRPALGELDVPLLEGVSALLEVRDHRVTGLPLHLVERMASVLGEEPIEPESLTRHRNVVVRLRHLASPLVHAPSRSRDRRITGW